MNIDTTTALIPVQVVQRPVLAIEQKGPTRFPQNHSPRKNLMTPTEYRRNNMEDNYGPYSRRRRTSVTKGRIIDLYA